jgi:hypothetical protein
MSLASRRAAFAKAHLHDRAEFEVAGKFPADLRRIAGRVGGRPGAQSSIQMALPEVVKTMRPHRTGQ